MSFKLKTNKEYRIMWSMYILKYVLPIFFVTFFGQNFLLLLSLFKCENDISSYYSEYAMCKYGSFYIFAPFTIIAIIIQLIIAFLTVSMHYKPIYIIPQKNKNSVLIKRNSIPDIIFFLCKIIIILLFMFDKEMKAESWGMLAFLSLLCGFNAYVYVFIQDYSNPTIKKFNDFLSLSLLVLDYFVDTKYF